MRTTSIDLATKDFGTDLAALLKRHKGRRQVDLGDLVEELDAAMDGLKQEIEDTL